MTVILLASFQYLFQTENNGPWCCS